MNYHVVDSIRNQNTDVLREQFATDVLMGLSSKPKSLPPKYIYDDKGSKLYEEIIDLEEYYLTECEHRIFLRHRETISKHFCQDGSFNLIELGAGDGRKTRVLIEQLLKDKASFRYIPIDISESAVSDLTKRFSQEFPSLVMHGVVGEYIDALRYALANYDGRNAVLSLGSSIGNFSRVNSTMFLRNVWKNLVVDDLVFIGFDLKKDIRKMTRAYDDSKGVTARFNLNLLERINRELGGTFDTTRFFHHEFYNPLSGAMESYLISLKEQKVYIDEIGKDFHFQSFEPIHVEYSYKFLDSDIEELSRESGFEIAVNFYDEQRQFVDSLWKVLKK